MFETYPTHTWNKPAWNPFEICSKPMWSLPITYLTCLPEAYLKPAWTLSDTCLKPTWKLLYAYTKSGLLMITNWKCDRDIRKSRNPQPSEKGSIPPPMEGWISGLAMVWYETRMKHVWNKIWNTCPPTYLHIKIQLKNATPGQVWNNWPIIFMLFCMAQFHNHMFSFGFQKAELQNQDFSLGFLRFAQHRKLRARSVSPLTHLEVWNMYETCLKHGMKHTLQHAAAMSL